MCALIFETLAPVGEQPEPLRLVFPWERPIVRFVNSRSGTCAVRTCCGLLGRGRCDECAS